jgi:hypothetical protein
VRNDYTGFIGMQITTGTKYLSVSSLGRFVLSGNTQAHLVKIVDASTGLDVGSVTIDTSAATAGKFAYAALSSPATLVPGISYYIVSQETSGGDGWYDNNTTVTTTLDASVIGGVSGDLTTLPENWSTGTTANQEYGPVDFLYFYRPQPPLQAGFTPITDPSQITGPGNYQLVNDVSSLFDIETSNVVVDGGGFQVTGTVIANISKISTNITVRNLRYYAAIIYGDTNTTPNETPAVTFTNNIMAAPPFTRSAAAVNGNNVTISNSIFVSHRPVTDDTILIFSYTDAAPQQFVTFSNNLIKGNFDCGIEGLGAGWQNMTFTGNTFRNCPICIGMWYSLAFGTTVSPTNCVFENNAADSTVGRLFQFRNGGSLSIANDDTTANSNWPGNTFSDNTHTT